MTDIPATEECYLAVIAALHESEGSICRGSCILRRPDVASIVSEALCHGRDERHLLHAWCVMPNHVHALLTPLGNMTLSVLLKSIKGFSARKINGLIGGDGSLWERESLDHVVRTPDHFDWFMHYIEHNPVAAGLCASAEHWQFSSAHPGHKRDVLCDWIDPRKTPFVHMSGRGELPHLYKDLATYFVTFRLLDAVQMRR